MPSPDADNCHLASLRALRSLYARTCARLPWLDASVCDDDAPLLPGRVRVAGHPCAKARAAVPGMRGRVAELRRAGAFDILRFDPRVGASWDILEPVLGELAATRTPLAVLHTDVAVEEIGAIASRWPDLALIVESGPVKLLYHFAAIEALLAAHPNCYLCTYNLCNWLGLERLCEAGLGERLLFGSHSPRYSVDVAMGPIALAHLPWERKCDLAGNDLRRLLGLALATPEEVLGEPAAPFIVDAHVHSGAPGRFPVPDEAFGPADWLSFMDRCSIETLIMLPFESLTDPSASPRRLTGALRRAAPGRVRFLEVFDPRAGAAHLRRIEESLADPDCLGIKIHPSFHETDAADPSYAPVYELAQRRGVPILTHSWDASETNPVQVLSHPSRFRRHLKRHHGVRLVLGHAGGRPGALEAVVALCREFPEVSVDLAGDYYDSGLVECLVERIGVSRVLFGSDMNWMDPRGNMAPILGSGLSDGDALAILRRNALAVYARR